MYQIGQKAMTVYHAKYNNYLYNIMYVYMYIFIIFINVNYSNRLWMKIKYKYIVKCKKIKDLKCTLYMLFIAFDQHFAFEVSSSILL